MKVPILLLIFAAIFMPGAALAGSEGIGWIPTWNQALVEAGQTGKPILLMTGEPSCGGVPGVW